MQQPALTQAVERLAMAGEQAGFSVEDMIQMLIRVSAWRRCWTSSTTVFRLLRWKLTVHHAGSCSRAHPPF
jgi:hypothetical protein